jgi:NAD(P)-dependent dehydrogenase (short-subunit alcohol dehydrogenase family)
MGRLDGKVVVVTGGGSGIGLVANPIQPAAVDESNLGTHVREDRQGAQTPTASLPRPKAWLPIRRAGKIKDEYGATIAFLMMPATSPALRYPSTEGIWRPDWRVGRLWKARICTFRRMVNTQ